MCMQVCVHGTRRRKPIPAHASSYQWSTVSHRRSEEVQHLHTRDLRSCIAMPKRIRTITYAGVRHKTVH